MRVCSAEAKALGVAVGMPLAETAALAGAATLALETYDPSADREALEALAISAGRFSPLIGLDDSPTPDSLLLDITGLAHLFGGEGSLADCVADDFTRRRFATHVAVADTVGAAWAVSHFGREDRQATHNHSQAATIIPPCETLSALRPLPVEALRISDDVIELLHQLGIHQIGQLELLSREDLPLRFGPRLIERWDQAVGRLAEPVLAHRPPPELRVEHLLEYPTARRETIEHVVEQLVARLCRMLIRRGRGVVRLDCRFDCQPARSVDLSVGVFQPTASPRHLFELARMRLERVWLPSPVSAVHVEAAVTAPFERRQEELFADGRQSRRLRQLAGLVDRLAGRLGRTSVLRARLVSDAQPERAYRYDSVLAVSPSGRSRRGRSDKHARVDLPPRPLRLVGRPVPLTAVSLMPDGPPLRFQFQGRRHRIVHARGPERIETGWWRGRPVRRDYYRVETATGHRYWLFRRLDDGGWFLHGTFE